jgi:hypothetical protein
MTKFHRNPGDMPSLNLNMRETCMVSGWPNKFVTIYNQSNDRHETWYKCWQTKIIALSSNRAQTCDRQEAEYHLLKFNTIASSSNRTQSHDKKLSNINSSLIPLHLRVIEHSLMTRSWVSFTEVVIMMQKMKIITIINCIYWMNGFFPSVGSHFVSYIMAERVSSDTSSWAGNDRYHIDDSIVACSKYRSTIVIRALLPFFCEKQLCKITSDILHYETC